MHRRIVLTFAVLSSTAMAQSFEGLDLGAPAAKPPVKKAAEKKAAPKPGAAAPTPVPDLGLGPALAEPTPEPATTAPPVVAEPVTPEPVTPEPVTPEPSDPGAAQAAAVSAAPAEAPVEEAPAPAFEISLKGGVHLPQVANPLDTSFDAILKVGYGLPFWQRRVQLFVDVSYTQPSTTSTGDDARLAGGSFTSTTMIRDLATSFGACVFILPPSRLLVPYVSAGVRVHFLRVETDGEAGGASFGQYAETDTRAGGVFAAGAGIRVGPGRIFAEVAFNLLPVDQRLTGASNASSLSVLAGYGLFF